MVTSKKVLHKQWSLHIANIYEMMLMVLHVKIERKWCDVSNIWKVC